MQNTSIFESTSPAINHKNGKTTTRNFSAYKKKADPSTSRGNLLMEKYKNNSVQKFMQQIDSSVERRKNVDRFDQSPQPVYPNFETQKASMQLGQIGWGVDKVTLQQSPVSVHDSIDRSHVKHWDKVDNQRFLKLTGEFTSSNDKKLELNPEIYHLMNASAQRISVKSLDMQRQSFQQSARGIMQRSQEKQSFPEVVSFLNNPFSKNNLNYSVKNQQPLITPRMASINRNERIGKP